MTNHVDEPLRNTFSTSGTHATWCRVTRVVSNDSRWPFDPSGCTVGMGGRKQKPIVRFTLSSRRHNTLDNGARLFFTVLPISFQGFISRLRASQSLTKTVSWISNVLVVRRNCILFTRQRVNVRDNAFFYASIVFFFFFFPHRNYKGFDALRHRDARNERVRRIHRTI